MVAAQNFAAVRPHVKVPRFVAQPVQIPLQLERRKGLTSAGQTHQRNGQLAALGVHRVSLAGRLGRRRAGHVRGGRAANAVICHADGNVAAGGALVHAARRQRDTRVVFHHGARRRARHTAKQRWARRSGSQRRGAVCHALDRDRRGQRQTVRPLRRRRRAQPQRRAQLVGERIAVAIGGERGVRRRAFQRLRLCLALQERRNRRRDTRRRSACGFDGGGDGLDGLAAALLRRAAAAAIQRSRFDRWRAHRKLRPEPDRVRVPRVGAQRHRRTNRRNGRRRRRPRHLSLHRRPRVLPVCVRGLRDNRVVRAARGAAPTPVRRAHRMSLHQRLARGGVVRRHHAAAHHERHCPHALTAAIGHGQRELRDGRA
mmetsp:Transcript_9110/g.28221  ORF Transcript_9110/g.28221 Transcript_9110/m.28221 type:complete len:371 (-) Transcript_9110:313-1425(-)